MFKINEALTVVRSAKRIVTLAGVCLILAASANAESISVNMDHTNYGAPAMAPDTIAGVVPAMNWNNVVNRDTYITFNDDSGAATELDVMVFATKDGAMSGGGTPNQLLGLDFAKDYGGLALWSVPYPKYDLYIYNSSLLGQPSSIITFTIAGASQHVMTYTPGPYETLEKDKNYVVFYGLTGDVEVQTYAEGGASINL
jgi:hypothetical protein